MLGFLANRTLLFCMGSLKCDCSILITVVIRLGIQGTYPLPTCTRTRHANSDKCKHDKCRSESVLVWIDYAFLPTQLFRVFCWPVFSVLIPSDCRKWLRIIEAWHCLAVPQDNRHHFTICMDPPESVTALQLTVSLLCALHSKSFWLPMGYPSHGNDAPVPCGFHVELKRLSESLSEQK